MSKKGKKIYLRGSRIVTLLKLKQLIMISISFKLKKLNKY